MRGGSAGPRHMHANVGGPDIYAASWWSDVVGWLYHLGEEGGGRVGSVFSSCLPPLRMSLGGKQRCEAPFWFLETCFITLARLEPRHTN
jgi:hypothetical protein